MDTQASRVNRVIVEYRDIAGLKVFPDTQDWKGYQVIQELKDFLATLVIPEFQVSAVIQAFLDIQESRVIQVLQVRADIAASQVIPVSQVTVAFQVTQE